ncbi:MAG: hypothetical protein IJL14_03350, partial [Selenomonadaceae bacterium]|nr:hypothetical protein [Selenomonadaceae bacterium]
MAVVRVWQGTDGPDDFFNRNSSTSQITLMSSYAGDDTLINAESGVWIDAGTDNNLVSLAATGNVSVISGTGNDTIDVATVDGARYNNFINVSGGDNIINNSNILQSTIYAGDGADTITSGGYGAFIEAGAGDNQIIISTDHGGNSIQAFGGNDYVSVTGG